LDLLHKHPSTHAQNPIAHKLVHPHHLHSHSEDTKSNTHDNKIVR
jgi:hypothetical protein